jgi:hypothetical protein
MTVNRKVRALDGLDMVAANPTEQANKLGLLAAALAKVNETPSRSVLTFVLSLSLSASLSCSCALVDNLLLLFNSFLLLLRI